MNNCSGHPSEIDYTLLILLDISVAVDTIDYVVLGVLSVTPGIYTSIEGVPGFYNKLMK